MNTRMWEHEATQANAATLRARGVELIGPEAGELAEGEVGLGRMSEPEAIAAPRRGAARSKCRSTQSPLAGAQVLVSAGGTREPLDAVRFLGNRSSGRMGVALAAEAKRRGAKVTLLASNLAVPRSGRRRGRRDADGRRRRARGDEPRGRGGRRRDGGRGRRLPAEPSRSRGSVPRPRKPGRSSSSRRWTCSPRSASRSATGRCSSASAPRRERPGLERKRRMLTDKNLDLVVYNDVSVPGHRLRRRPRTR